MYVTFFIAIALLGCTEAGVNVAVGKPANQSSYYSRPLSAPGVTGVQPAGVAVDGAPLPESCSGLNTGDDLYSHTQQSANSWWRVDLEKVYHIYRLTLCNRGSINNFQLNGAEVLTTTADNPPSLNTTRSNWTAIYSVPSPAGDFRDLRYNASISARHVAVYNSQLYHGVILREVTVEGFSRDDIDEIDIQLSAEDRTPFNVTVKASINGYNGSVFESTRMILKLEKSDGTDQTLRDVIVRNGGESINFLHLELSPSTTYNYKLELFTYEMMIKSKTATSVHICKEPQKAGRLNVAQAIDHQNQANSIKLSIRWQVPSKTGCEPWMDTVLTYIISVNSTTYNTTNLFIDVNVKAFTKYEVSVRAVNYQDKKSVWSRLQLQTISAVLLEDITISPDQENKKPKDGLSSGVIAGIVIVPLVVVTLIIFLRKRDTQQTKNKGSISGKENSPEASSPQTNDHREYEEINFDIQSSKPQTTAFYETVPDNFIPTKEDHQYATLSSQYEVVSSARVGDDHVYAETNCRGNQQLSSVTSSSQGDSSAYSNVGLEKNYENVSNIQ